MRVREECAERDRISVSRVGNHVPCLWSEHADIARLGSQVAIRSDARIDVLGDDLAPVLRRSNRGVGEQAIAVGKDANVGSDLSLWRERRGVLAVTRLERKNVVGDEPRHELRSALSTEPDADAITAIDYQCSRAQRRILVSVVHTLN